MSNTIIPRDKEPGARPSSDDIVRLAGDLDDETVAEVMATGATFADVEQAVMWAIGNAETLAKSGHALSGLSAVVYDILISDPAFVPLDERERGT